MSQLWHLNGKITKLYFGDMIGEMLIYNSCYQHSLQQPPFTQPRLKCIYTQTEYRWAFSRCRHCFPATELCIRGKFVSFSKIPGGPSTTAQVVSVWSSHPLVCITSMRPHTCTHQLPYFVLLSAFQVQIGTLEI